ncbi:MAG TPA: hypothetical protein VN754_02755 [Candidatus Binataceae bacterium]|nr:hypothetical protein [Candidatus Binataceae bacterium]
MTKSLAVVLFALLAVGLILNQPSFAQQPSSSAQPAPSPAPPAPHGHGIGEATILIIHGKVASVDRAKRLVTLVGLEGNKVTFKVAKSANIASVKAGDPFVAHFFESVHVRRQRPGEVLPAVSIKEGISTATTGQTPGSVVHTKRKVMLTVVAIDPKDGTVTVKDPDGTEETVKVDNSKYLSNVKPGDDLVVTVRQAVAISLDKE